ncbi:hypothetical protein EYZ11_001240 [Aspergillus tanneri]|uniref:Annexin n=1 Tax=Aspergillus tanneri TaxID=1220188 RepID=A0A4S3JV18_9EURO|nr:uncharacterized protein ATNIH1004_007147 [Aspergillus tanneri]KAA8645728.1 hypothetical protein ATNIH1004_007147 [Aspergillus tanneri]THC99241.1 hypothetical protein EYZ11_001240 [Aspergillus tanneri]
MSLQVGDPRSRGRSKSPSGRTRDRSRSRDNRQPSPGPDMPRASYLNPNLGSEYPRSYSRSRGTSPSRGYRTSSRYRPSGSDSGEDDRSYYLRPERSSDHYYHSDSGESKATRQRGKSYTRSPNLRPVQYGSSDESLDSDDDALAYGDIPGGMERGFYGYTASPRASSSRVDTAQMSGALNADKYFKNESSRAAERLDEGVPGSHPSYARPNPFKYAVPSQYPHSQSASQSNWAPIPECERPGFVPPSSRAEEQAMPGAFPPASTHPELSATPGVPAFPMPQYANMEGQHNSYAPMTGRPISVSTGNAYAPSVASPTHQRHLSDTSIQPSYARPAQFQYADIDPKVKYTSKSTSKPFSYSSERQFSKASTAGSSQPQYTGVRYSATPQFSKTPTSREDSEQQYVEITPGRRTGTRPASLSVSSANNLSVAGPDPNFRPASPLQEPYKGTYQSISPMPSPIVIPSKLDEDISDLEPLDGGSDVSGHRKHRRKKSRDEKDRKEKNSDRSKRDNSRVRHERHDSNGRQSLVLISPASSRKRVSFYDVGPDAVAMQEALNRTRSIDTKTIIRVLPHLTSEEMLDLRKEYKNHVRFHGKGINLAKHIRLKLGNSAFGKVCYATALGRWESEAFWANCYYQSSTSRRELLIESLFGRINSEISEIKECFRDSRYSDSLEKCMKAELKADKFRLAVLLALEENRQSERDPINMDLVQRDVDELHRALISRNGGETAMISIIVRRSDSHLREVLRAYEKVYNQNFARAMIAKSQNLVGETLAHILNGVINRPMRDALLLHQALRESRTGKERSELLISRLVRFHWEPRHLELVKGEFRRRYGERLEEAIAEEILPTSGGSEWGEFCIELARSSKTLAGRA